MSDINIHQFHNINTLNIFTDASISGKSGNYTGCYGVVAVTEDNIQNQIYKLVSNTTNNNSEIKGIRAGLCIASQYINNYKYINLFSDSQVSINGLREYIYKWIINPEDNKLYTRTNREVANQSIFIECHKILKDLANSSCIITLYHQPAHVNDKYSDLLKAAESFRKSNNIMGNIDLNFIRYITTWNNHVDSNSRSMLRRNRNNNNIYRDPVTFIMKPEWI